MNRSITEDTAEEKNTADVSAFGNIVFFSLCALIYLLHLTPYWFALALRAAAVSFLCWRFALTIAASY